MKILIDENMPYAEALFSQLGDVVLKAGRQMTAEDLIDVDALMIRSVTKVNDAFLKKANKLKFVGTATAGMDHVDQILLSDRGVFFTAAPGCNKVGVAEYVLSSLMVLGQQNGFSIFDKTIGIIGVGQVGSYLYDCLTGIGIKVLLNDPLKQLEGDCRHFTPLDELTESSDVITLHTPLTQSGDWPTYHLFDEERLNKLRANQILINAARGPVVDNQALKIRLEQNDGFTAVLDVFEYEPEVDLSLLPLLAFATPHIAGYGLEGKARGTTMIFNRYCQFIGAEQKSNPIDLLPVAPISEVVLSKPWDEPVLNSLVQLIYDIRKDDALFRRNIGTLGAFDKMRKEYWDRREYRAITVKSRDHIDLSSLKNLGFKVEVTA